MKQKNTASQKVAPAVVPAPRFDATGHMNPAHAQRLRELSGDNQPAEPKAFIETSSTRDDLAEGLAEAAVTSMTTGGDELGADLEAEVTEELGGPFVETSGSTEFADGTDESNIEGATREPFPTT